MRGSKPRLHFFGKHSRIAEPPRHTSTLPMKIVQLTTDNREYSKNYAAAAPYFGTAPEALLEGFAQLPDVEVHVVCCLRAPVQSPVKLAPNIHYHSLLVPKSGWMSTFYQGCIRAVRQTLKELDPDIVHGQGTERDCAISAVYSGFPNVVTIHGNMAELQRLGLQGHRMFGALAARLETHALRRTEGVFCNSAYTDGLVKPRAKKTWGVPNPIRSAFFQPVAGTPNSDIPHFLNVGLVNPRKRQLEILQSLRKLKHAGYDFKIIFAGGLSETSEYGKRFVEELKAAEKEGFAEYAGFLDVRQMVELMDRCSGFIHFPTEEAFGLVVAEAMARGLKFFGANLGGIRDIVQGIPSAETFDDFNGLETGIRNWLGTGAPRHPEVAAVIADRYHPQVIAQRHMEIYREVLNK